LLHRTDSVSKSQEILSSVGEGTL